MKCCTLTCLICTGRHRTRTPINQGAGDVSQRASCSNPAAVSGLGGVRGVRGPCAGALGGGRRVRGACEGLQGGSELTRWKSSRVMSSVLACAPKHWSGRTRQTCTSCERWAGLGQSTLQAVELPFRDAASAPNRSPEPARSPVAGSGPAAVPEQVQILAHAGAYLVDVVDVGGDAVAAHVHAVHLGLALVQLLVHLLHATRTRGGPGPCQSAQAAASARCIWVEGAAAESSVWGAHLPRVLRLVTDVGVHLERVGGQQPELRAQARTPQSAGRRVRVASVLSQRASGTRAPWCSNDQGGLPLDCLVPSVPPLESPLVLKEGEGAGNPDGGLAPGWRERTSSSPGKSPQNPRAPWRRPARM